MKVTIKPSLRKAAEYIGPTTAADVTVEAWNSYFDEGGTLNQPRWLQTGRLKQLRRQFETLARLHRNV